MSTETSNFQFAPLARIATGGTATVYVGAPCTGARGTRVALKRPHEHVLDDERQRATLLKEAHLASSLHHPNIVEVHEIEVAGRELQLVMDYVEGAALGALIAKEARSDARIPPPIAVRIMLDACAGLAAVHEQKDEAGRPLGLIHRDVSPQNILVGVDGVARLTDFGLAKALYEGAPSTTEGSLKGKLGYMAPEYVNRGHLDRAVDVFAMGVVLWEALAGQRLFRGDNEAQTLDRVLRAEAKPLGDVSPDLARLDGVVARAVAKDRAARFASVGELADALAGVARGGGGVATHAEVGAYVMRVANAELSELRARVEEAEQERRKPTRRAAAAVLALTLVAASTLWLRTHRHPSAPATNVAGATAAAQVPAPGPPLAESPSALSVPSSTPTPVVAPSASTAASPRARPTAVPGRIAPPNPYVHRPAPR
jgi:serine/threonine protein kinase